MSTNEPTDLSRPAAVVYEFCPLHPCVWVRAFRSTSAAERSCPECYKMIQLGRLLFHGPFDHTPRCTTGACND